VNFKPGDRIEAVEEFTDFNEYLIIKGNTYLVVDSINAWGEIMVISELGFGQWFDFRRFKLVGTSPYLELFL